jgi:uncharacterized protein
MKTVYQLMVLFCVLSSGASLAQQQQHAIIALASPRYDSIVIRWAPAGQMAWLSGNRHGYLIERFVVARDGKPVVLAGQQAQQLTAAPIRPVAEAQMEQMAVKDDRVALVKEAIYSKEFQVTAPEKGVGDFIIKQGEADMRFGFMLLACDLSPAAANAAGLRFVDRSVKKGERYAYKISVAQQPKGITIEPGVCVTSLQEIVRLSPPREFSVHFLDSLARLQWLSNIDKGIYTAYTVERSADGKNFKPVTDLPVINSTDKPNQPFNYFIDTLTDNETTWYYRIKGLTPFGGSGPYSQVVNGRGAAAIDLPFLDTIASIDNKKILLQWHLSALLKSKTTSVFITRAAKAEGPYKDISPALGKDVISFTDEKPAGDGYYRLKIKTTDNRMVFSLPALGQVIDVLPPAMPVGVKGIIDSTGIVHLEWNANTEADLRGYRIFRANAAHEEFTEVTRRVLRKNSFTDTVTIQTLSEKVLYRVVAVDKVYNPSEYSDIFTLNRPDKIAPSAPVFTYGRPQDTVAGILLKWKNSTSSDVVKQVMYRVSSQVGSFNKDIVFTDSANYTHEWLDTAVQAGSKYYYELVAYDEAGNQSKDRSGDIVYETAYRPAIKDIQAQVNRDKKQISVEWKHNQEPAVYYIYRSVNNQGYLLYKKLTGAQKSVTDGEIKIGNTYMYRIKAEWTSGKTTMMSKPVTVQY